MEDNETTRKVGRLLNAIATAAVSYGTRKAITYDAALQWVEDAAVAGSSLERMLCDAALHGDVGFPLCGRIAKENWDYFRISLERHLRQRLPEITVSVKSDEALAYERALLSRLDLQWQAGRVWVLLSDSLVTSVQMSDVDY